MPRSTSPRRGLSNRVSSPTSSSCEATRSRRRTESPRCGSDPRGLAGTGGTPSPRDLESCSAACARDLGLQRAGQAPPHPSVLAQLVFVVVHLGPPLQRRFCLSVGLS